MDPRSQPGMTTGAGDDDWGAGITAYFFVIPVKTGTHARNTFVKKLPWEAVKLDA